ncbi:MAG: nucleotidyltransferase domain-containing protein [Myxococcales bacterium]|nr:nucleotidyltransferase domain-containing protein [Myxococcales bacterium]
MTELIAARRASTGTRFEELREHLEDARERSSGKACVYVIGSFARGEASAHSDLDLFIVGYGKDAGPRYLSGLDAICIKADLIKATRQLGIPEFSGDGEYLEHYAIADLIKALGRPEDDANNTFTARMLLLLESKPLIGSDVHADAIDRVLEQYWRDYEDHKDGFIPAFLANDILRMWRTFCVNYEARTQTDPPERKAKRKLKNYKLKHSRLLTCYSALAYLSTVYARAKTVNPDDAKEMAGRMPLERLEWIAEQGSSDAERIVSRILEAYEAFLRETDAPETELIELFMGPKRTRELPDANALGNLMAELLAAVGGSSRFHRLLLV